MNLEDCKPGTEVIIRGRIIGTGGYPQRPVLVRSDRGGDCTCDWYFSPDCLEAANQEPNRKFLKGDTVRLVNHGRPAPVTLKYGKTYVLEEDENQIGGVLVDNMLISYSLLELVEPRKEMVYDISGCEAIRLMVEEHCVMARKIDGTNCEVVKLFHNDTIMVEIPDETGELEWKSSIFTDLDLISKWRIVERKKLKKNI